MRRINYIVSIHFLLAFTSCVKQVDYKLPQQEVYPIVYSFLSPDSVLSCHIWQSEGVLRNYGIEYSPIQDAQVLMIENGILYDTLSYRGGGYYKGHSFAKMGASYSLHIALENKVLESETSIPYASELDSVIIRLDETYYHPQSQFYLPLNKIYIHDSSLNTNFYEFFYFWYYYPNELDSSKISVSPGASGDVFYTNIDYKIKDDLALENMPYSLLFSDKYFNGKRANINISWSIMSEHAALRTLSKEYYQFKQSYYAHLHSIELNNDEGAGLVKQILFGGEPIKMYSNIKGGGYGVFAGFSQDTVKTIIYQ